MNAPDTPSIVIAPLPSPARPLFASLRRASRLLYTQNPFYLLSAWLVFFGLRWSFGAGGQAPHSAALFGGLLSYTLLLALAAVVVVRIAKVWDDARSMLLLMVLLFFGTSVALDETLVQDFQRGAVYYGGAWCLAALTSELVLRAIRLRLPGWYRGAFHALIALFHAYPVALAPWFSDPSHPRLQWMLFGFASCGAACFALLWPAVRRGGDYVRENGSPWPWPLYPWSLFAILALCVAGRAYSLCLSFHFVGSGANIFGLYFLLPLAWCLTGLTFSAMRRAGWDEAASGLLLVPILWHLMASLHRSEPLYGSFLNTFTNTLHASPLFLNLIATFAFYGYAFYRRVFGAEFFLTLTTLAFACVAPRTQWFADVATPFAWPFAVAAAWQAYCALRRRSEWRWLCACGFGVVALDLSLSGVSVATRCFVAYQLLLLAVLTLGYFGRSDLARWLRRSAGPVFLLLAAAWYPLFAALFPHWPEVAPLAFLTVLWAIAICYAALLRLRVYFLAAAGIVMAGVVFGAWPWYGRIRSDAPGTDVIALGLASLLVGLLVSFAKSGLLRRAWLNLRTYESLRNAGESASGP